MSRIRVGLDARLAGWPGIGRYIQILSHGLANRTDDIDLVVYVNPGVRLDIRGTHRQRLLRARPFGPLEQVSLPRAIAQDRIELFHTPHLNIPLHAGIRRVVTIHDLVGLKFPARGLAGIGHRLYYRQFNKWAVRLADAIITVSEFSRAELASFAPGSSAKVFVVHNCVDPGLLALPNGRDELGPPPAHMSAPYVLYVGTNKPWKNLEVALRGLDHCWRGRPVFRVLIAGRQARHQEGITSLLRRLRPSVPVTVLGDVTDGDLVQLYRAATAVVCPSRYEGFGLTALEAMACGAPVVHSGAASLPEVTGDAAIDAGTDDPLRWSAAIRALLDDEKVRRRLIVRGRARAASFSAERMIDATVRIYGEVVTSDGQDRPETRRSLTRSGLLGVSE